MDAITKFKIDKGVPFVGTLGGRNGKYPFRQMEVGDSFLFPPGHATSHYYGMAREFTSQCMATGSAWKFKTKKTPDGFRCWRIE